MLFLILAPALLSTLFALTEINITIKSRYKAAFLCASFAVDKHRLDI